MPSIKDLWPDRWLKPEHLQSKRPRVAIAAVTVEELFNPRTKKNEPRLIVAFHNKTLRLVCNKTQAQSIATVTASDDFTHWPGFEIVLSVGRAPNGSDTILISPVPDKPAPTPATQLAEEEERLRRHYATIDDDEQMIDADIDPVTVGDFKA
jgi:hypothetical protein